MSIKSNLKKCVLTKGLYNFLKNKRDQKREKNNFKFHGKFIDRKKNFEKLLIVLAGYKGFLYESVFSRIEKFLPKDIDVCIISSGLYAEDLVRLCEKNDWSYLSTKENNVCLVQNVAINLHDKAKYIYKLDEDIFIAENYFENLLRAYEHASCGDYMPGVIAPIIPINGFSHVILLEKLGLKDVYSEKFETVKHMAGPSRKIENDPNVAKFLWGDGGHVDNIDNLNARFGKDPIQERACPIRFSIGAILFERKLWQEMGYFKVNRGSPQMGADEEQLCAHCMISSRPLMVSENALVGHLSFGPQNVAMKDYYLNNKNLFLLEN